MKILNLIKKYGTLIGFFGIIMRFFTINLPSTFLTAKNFINISQANKYACSCCIYNDCSHGDE